MDIKLKKLTNNTGTKAIAFLLCVSLCVAAVAVGMGTFAKLYTSSDGNYNLELSDILMADSYEKSNSIQWNFHSKAWSINEKLHVLTEGVDGTWNNANVVLDGGQSIELSDEAYGAAYDETVYAEGLFRTYLIDYYDYFLLEDVDDTKFDLFLNSLDDTNVPLMAAGVIDEAAARAAFQTAYSGQLAQVKEQRNLEGKQQLKDIEESLNKHEGFLYYATDGQHVITNLLETYTVGDARAQIENQPAYRLISGGEVIAYPSVEQVNGRHGANDYLIEVFSDEKTNYTVYMAFDEGYVTKGNTVLAEAAGVVQTGLIAFGLTAVGALICLAYLIATCGKRDEKGIVVLKGMGRWLTDIHLILLGSAGFAVICLMFLVAELYQSMYQQYNSVHPLFLILWCAGTAILISIGLGALLGLVNKIKAKKFFHDMILIRLLLAAFYGIKSIFDGTTVVKKAVIAVTLVCIGSATVFFFPIMLIGAIYIAVRYAKMFDELKKGVKISKNGDLEYKIPTEMMAGELMYLAEDINELSDGFDLAVKQELKNQRLKTELISNVSHDIKTPLTSIITYVDLLKKEGLDCEDAPKYLDILDQKSIRLKKLTEDLFEAAKASSGDIPVNLERVELLSLINQGLGEMDQKLKQNGLEIIIKAGDEKYGVLADGQLLWRVVENILGNAVKYAQEHSRIYIDLSKELDQNGKVMAKVEFKNISKDPLNIPSEELMERFKRGDEARNTEGSGLGLSIAKDLMQIQNGEFFIVVDGDLFKAVFMVETFE